MWLSSFFVDMFLADLFRVHSSEDRPGSPIQNGEETEDDIDIVGSEEENMINEEGVRRFLGHQVINLQQLLSFLLTNEEVVKGWGHIKSLRVGGGLWFL